MTNEQEPKHAFHITTVEETEERITLRVSRTAEETVVFTYTPGTKEVTVQFGKGEQERNQPPEREVPEITLEGRIAKDANTFGGAKYDKEKHTFSVRIAHQYTSDNPKEAWYYTVVAEGEAADEAYRLYLTRKGIPVRVGGWDISGSMKLDKGTTGVIQAEFIERLPPGTKPIREILPGRVRRADNSRGADEKK